MVELILHGASALSITTRKLQLTISNCALLALLGSVCLASLQVLACGLFHSPNRPDMPPAHQAEYTHTWVIGAQRALQLADWSGKPSLTCIQSVVLLPIVLMHAGGIKRLASWIAAALRMAQLLDLHKLDDSTTLAASTPGGKTAATNATSVPGQNGRRPAAGSSLTPVEREIGKRESRLDDSARRMLMSIA